MSNNQEDNIELNKFEEQLNDINEWQNNATNPWYYVGSGKSPTPIRNMLKSPILIFIIGVVLAISVIFNIVSNFTFENILNNLTTMVISAAFIIGGIIRLLNR